VEVTENGDISSHGEDGVAVNAQAGSMCGGPDDSLPCDWAANNNLATVKINHNANIRGEGGEGVDFDAAAGTEGDVSGGTADVDHNTAVGEVIGNGDITSSGDVAGLDADVYTVGYSADSLDNHNTLTIADNGRIIGEDGDGILIDARTCCDAADTNTLTIQNNSDIIGHAGHGINFADPEAIGGAGICCSVNIVTIMDNTGVITGQDGNGINYLIQTDTSNNDYDSNGFPDSIEHSVNSLTISGNTITNSSVNGVDICCGAFDAGLVAAGSSTSGVVAKSVISNNMITGNGENGVFLDTVQGINIGPNNTITGNGFASDSNVHAGIQIVNDLADFWDPFAVYLASDGNTITQNSIYDNHNAFTDTLGIDLNPNDLNPRVGCITKDDPISPNTCIQAPVITLVAEGGKVGGTTCALCTVEIFAADSNPPDQPRTVSAIQNGEGALFLASGPADDAGNFSVVLPCDLPAGDLTATATDKVKNTSEFSLNRPFLGTGPCATATPTASDTPTATNTPMPTSTATPPTKACGDVNDDGHVNSVDAQLVLQYSAGLVTTLANMPSADVNSSSGVNPVDAALILQVEAGLIPLGSLNCM
jgi:hypothetical protein